jgi:hypothetical protein
LRKLLETQKIKEEELKNKVLEAAIQIKAESEHQIQKIASKSVLPSSLKKIPAQKEKLKDTRKPKKD